MRGMRYAPMSGRRCVPHGREDPNCLKCHVQEARTAANACRVAHPSHVCVRSKEGGGREAGMHQARPLPKGWGRGMQARAWWKRAGRAVGTSMAKYGRQWRVMAWKRGQEEEGVCVCVCMKKWCGWCGCGGHQVEGESFERVIRHQGGSECSTPRASDGTSGVPPAPAPFHRWQACHVRREKGEASPATAVVLQTVARMGSRRCGEATRRK